MKKVVYISLSFLLIAGCVLTYFNYKNYNDTLNKRKEYKEEIKTNETKKTNIEKEIKTKEEEINNLKEEKKDKLEDLEEWKTINQEVINSLS